MRVHGSDFSHRHCRNGHLPALQCQHVAASCAEMAICYGCSNVRLRRMVVQCAMMCFFCTTGRLFKAPASQNFAVPRLLQDLDHSKCPGWRSAASTRPVCNVGYDNASWGGATMADILQWAMRTSGLTTLQLRCIIVSLHSGSVRVLLDYTPCPPASPSGPQLPQPPVPRRVAKRAIVHRSSSPACPQRWAHGGYRTGP